MCSQVHWLLGVLVGISDMPMGWAFRSTINNYNNFTPAYSPMAKSDKNVICAPLSCCSTPPHNGLGFVGQTNGRQSPGDQLEFGCENALILPVPSAFQNFQLLVPLSTASCLPRLHLLNLSNILVTWSWVRDYIAPQLERPCTKVNVDQIPDRSIRNYGPHHNFKNGKIPYLTKSEVIFSCLKAYCGSL